MRATKPQTSLVSHPRYGKSGGSGGAPRDVGFWGWLKRSLPPVLMGMAISGLVMLGWFAHREQNNVPANVELPVIKADKTPFKIRPENPGGRTIPHQDKLIYDLINPDAKKKEPEVIQYLERPEQPMVKRTAPPAETEAPASTQAQDPNYIPDAVAIPQGVPAKLSPWPDVPEPVLKTKLSGYGTRTAPLRQVTQPVQQETQQPVRAAAPAPVVQQPQAEPKAMEPAEGKLIDDNDKIRVQLGSYKTISSAKAGWASLQRRFRSDLKGLDYVITKVELGSRGVFYRLLAGPFSSEEQARRLCFTFSTQQQGCIVAKP